MAKEENQMLFRRNENNHNDYSRVYDHPLNENKYIRVRCDLDHQITSIELVTVWEICPDHYDGRGEEFRPEGLLYLENVCHGEDNEILDTNLLMIVEEQFREVC